VVVHVLAAEHVRVLLAEPVGERVRALPSRALGLALLLLIVSARHAAFLACCFHQVTSESCAQLCTDASR
jgi:hypothetical protein